MYIYIYIEREREIERARYVILCNLSLCIGVCMLMS